MVGVRPSWRLLTAAAARKTEAVSALGARRLSRAGDGEGAVGTCRNLTTAAYCVSESAACRSNDALVFCPMLGG